MSHIDRRDFMKVTGAGGIALSAGAAHNLLTANEARAQEAHDLVEQTVTRSSED